MILEQIKIVNKAHVVSAAGGLDLSVKAKDSAKTTSSATGSGETNFPQLFKMLKSRFWCAQTDGLCHLSPYQCPLFPNLKPINLPV